MLLRVADTQDLDIARQLIHAHEYWRTKRFAVELVILNERASSYTQDLQVALETIARTSQAPEVGPQLSAGRVFVLRADLISAETRALLASVARVVLVGQRGRLVDQLDRVRDARVFAVQTRSASSPACRRQWLRACRTSNSSTGLGASQTMDGST